jgi:hypothetical protein
VPFVPDEACEAVWIDLGRWWTWDERTEAHRHTAPLYSRRPNQPIPF